MNIAMITGASSGMGRDFARLLDKENLDELWVIARRENRLLELQEQLTTPVRVISADLTREEELQKIQEALNEEKLRVRYLVNAAGFGKFGDYSEITPALQQAMIDLNIKGLVAVTNLVLPYMEKGDRVIQLCSSSSFFPLPYLNVYASTKAFVQHYSYGLYEELKPRGITVTQVSPGWVKTEFFEGFQSDASHLELKKYSPLYSSQRVVEQALKDAKKGKKKSVCGLFVKFHCLCGRFAPRWFMQWQWRSRLRSKKKK